MRWSDLTWSEIPDVLARCGHAAVLPVGATEQHGPHLGCGVDFVIAEKLCAAVAAQTGVPMLPRAKTGMMAKTIQPWLAKAMAIRAMQAGTKSLPAGIKPLPRCRVAMKPRSRRCPSLPE